MRAAQVEVLASRAMNIDAIRQRLRALGARPSHEARLLRAWLQGWALDAGPHTESNRLPKALQGDKL